MGYIMAVAFNLVASDCVFLAVRFRGLHSMWRNLIKALPIPLFGALITPRLQRITVCSAPRLVNRGGRTGRGGGSAQTVITLVILGRKK